MTPEEIARLSNQIFVSRINPGLPKSNPTPEQIELGLTHESSSVRRAFAECPDIAPTPEQVERGLTDEEFIVRWAFARRTDLALTSEQVERGLTDGEAVVRQTFIARKDFLPTQAQFERGIQQDDDEHTRNLWRSALDRTDSQEDITSPLLARMQSNLEQIEAKNAGATISERTQSMLNDARKRQERIDSELSLDATKTTTRAL